MLLSMHESVAISKLITHTCSHCQAGLLLRVQYFTFLWVLTSQVVFQITKTLTKQVLLTQIPGPVSKLAVTFKTKQGCPLGEEIPQFSSGYDHSISTELNNVGRRNIFFKMKHAGFGVLYNSGAFCEAYG